MFNTITVTITESTTKVNVKQRYFPKSGIDKDVVGIISMRTSKKKMSDSMIDIDNDTFLKQKICKKKN